MCAYIYITAQLYRDWQVTLSLLFHTPTTTMQHRHARDRPRLSTRPYLSSPVLQGFGSQGIGATGGSRNLASVIVLQCFVVTRTPYTPGFGATLRSTDTRYLEHFLRMVRADICPILEAKHKTMLLQLSRICFFGFLFAERSSPTA